MIHAADGDAEHAIDLIVDAVERRQAWVWDLRADPRLASVRQHAEFRRVEEVVGIPLTEG